MRDTVTLTSIGGSIGFTISPTMLNDLGIDLGDSVEIELKQIYRQSENPLDVSTFMRRKIIKVGGGSKGVIIKKNIVKQFKLEPGINIGIDINTGTQ